MPEPNINQRSPVPLYHQLRDIIRQYIETGEWEPGHKIPSESELAAQHHISRVTVRQATSALIHAGLLYTEKGRGTFVASRRLGHHLTKLVGFSEVVKEMGLRASAQVLVSAVQGAPQNVAAQLKIAPGRPVFCLQRVRLADELPVALETSFIPAAICPGIERYDFEVNSFYNVIEGNFGVQLEVVKQTLQICKASDELAEHLQVEVGESLFELTGVVSDASDRPVEAFTVYYRSDLMKFHLTATRNV